MPSPSPTDSPNRARMASSSDARSATSGGGVAAAKADLEDFFDQLDLNDEEFADVQIDEQNPEIEESVWWLALVWRPVS
ncbi:hypothetical protein D1007_23749 [Hordeum vulgare]|nr:hypothetical protein D1007_23749 [Hordeum vulgare]